VLLCSMVALLCCAVGLTAVQIHRRHRFKARLLEDEDQLGALHLTRGSSGQGAQRQSDLDQEDPTAAVVGLSRPASPGGASAATPGENAQEPEPEPEPENAPEPEPEPDPEPEPENAI
jgi:hypothetical protein